jgi:cyclopropane-fatty-acyl-phospholipid synthase
MSFAAKHAIGWVEQGLVPDRVIRSAIRRLLQARLSQIHADDVARAADLKTRFIDAMRDAPIAPLAYKANEQHYELPAEFFVRVLGPHCKYSACYWGEGVARLADAEAMALQITCERAGVADGQRILELGCGWGSLSLFMAERYPNCSITAVSNSASQRSYIVEEAQRRGIRNLAVVTRDMSEFATEEHYDRVISVEMFEHMRNYRELFRRISTWLAPHGRFFLHIFVHRNVPYEFADASATDWMSRYFFAGGMMPSADLPLYFQDHLRLTTQWSWGGEHYARTAEAWLENLDARSADILPVLARAYGHAAAPLWLQRWRLFFMACAELWAFRNGQEWFVGHYLFAPRCAP